MYSLHADQIEILRKLKKARKYTKTFFFFKEDKVELLRLAQLVEFNYIVRSVRTTSDSGTSYIVELTRDGLDRLADHDKKMK